MRPLNPRSGRAAPALTLTLVAALGGAMIAGVLIGFGGPATPQAAPEGRTPPNAWVRAWPDTDFSRASVDFDEVLSGGPPKDGIPSIDAPQFHAVGEESTLDPREPVIGLEIAGEARAYPIRYLMWHEIVNDRVAGAPVAVTYCPLCNSAIVFDGRLAGAELTFGVSGLLRHSDMIMYDRQSESWWQQFTGEAIVGARLGQTLTVIPSMMISWARFQERFPDGQVMRAPTGFGRDYGRNPYVGYDSTRWPFLYRGERPPHGIEPLARVVRVGDRAWPLSRLAEAGEIVEDGVRLTWFAGQASALDAREVAEGRDVGDVLVFDAQSGALVAHEVVFAFAFHAFAPEGRWMLEAHAN